MCLLSWASMLDSSFLPPVGVRLASVRLDVNLLLFGSQFQTLLD